jgi:hypothetical protein
MRDYQFRVVPRWPVRVHVTLIYCAPPWRKQKEDLMKARFVSAMIVMACSSAALALPASIDLTLTDATPTTSLAATGFDNAYNLDTTDTANVHGTTVPAFSVGSGGLSIATLPGDTYGQYDTTTPNSAVNFFYSGLDPDGATGTTIATVDMNIQNLNNNFHGGGIWMGMDENHYIRLGIINNGTSINAEAIRENMDLWSGAPIDPGPGGDIVDQQIGGLGTSPQTGSLNVILKIVRTGTLAQAFVSTNNGTSYQQLGGAGYNFDNIDTLASQMNNPSTDANDTPPEFKVGVYALGGGSSNLGDALATFTNFSAVSTPVPEPASLGLALLGLPMMLRRKRM